MKLVNTKHLQAWSEEVKKFINTNLDLETTNKLLYDTCIKSFGLDHQDGIEAYKGLVGLTLDLLHREREWLGFDRTGLKILCEFLKFNNFIIPNHYHKDSRFLYDILRENKNVQSKLFPKIYVDYNQMCIQTIITAGLIEITIIIYENKYEIKFRLYNAWNSEYNHEIMIELKNENNINTYYENYNEIDCVEFYKNREEYFSNKLLENFYMKIDDIRTNI